MSFRCGRLPPMTRVADWNRLAQNGPTGSFRDAEIRKMLPNGFKTYKLQQEKELTAAQRKQITKYDQEIIELEKAIKISAEEIREMERNEAEAFRKYVTDVDKEEVAKACKVENDGNNKTKKRKKKKKNANNNVGADCRKADVDIGDANTNEEKELDDKARKLVADALHAAVKLEAKLIVADVVNSAVKIAQADNEVKMMSAHISVIVDNAIKGAVNAMKATQNESEMMDAKAKEIADDAIRRAVNDVKDDNKKHEMDIKGALKVMQVEKEKHEMNAKAKEIVDVAIKGAVNVMKTEHANAELDARAKESVDTAIKGAVRSMKAEKEENEMDARAKEIVYTAIQYATNDVKVKHATDMVQRKVDADVDNGNVLVAMLGQNGYDHRRIHVQVAPERFTEKERTDICQYWSEKLGIATPKNTNLYRDVTYFGRM